MIFKMIEPQKPLLSSNNENGPNNSMQLVNIFGHADGSDKENRSEKFSNFFYKCHEYFRSLTQTNFLNHGKSTLFGNGPFAFMAYIGGNMSGHGNPFEQPTGSSIVDEFNKCFPRLAMPMDLPLLGGSAGGPRTTGLSMVSLLSDGNNKLSPFSRNEPTFLALYHRSLAEGKCLWCGLTEVEQYKAPCGHELWCVGHKLWALNVVKHNPHFCITCDHHLKALEQFSGRYWISDLEQDDGKGKQLDGAGDVGDSEGTEAA